jgi:NAD(P)H-hydrate epimerase
MIRLTRAQVREIDRLATEKYHIPGIVLMENAARGAADVAMEMLAGVNDPSALIVCGGGNNGGDGLAIARHLHNRGVDVQIIQVWDTEPRGDALTNLRIARAMGLKLGACRDQEHFDARRYQLGIDALFGTGLTRPVQGEAARVVDFMNRAGFAILAADIPSGLDCDTGEALGASVRATRTVTFVAEKTGFANPRAGDFLGKVTVADIGCPRDLIDQVTRPGSLSGVHKHRTS